jgi:hypothetical protein
LSYLTSSKLHRVYAAAILAVSVWPATAWAGKKPLPPPPPLPLEHKHPSGSFTFRTPEDWKVAPSASNPDMMEAAGKDLTVRFLYRHGEGGLDTTHVDCMMERLAGPMVAEPQVQYEYDFKEGMLGNHRALDSAFVVIYDSPIRGQREWRQRNLTLVGAGETLCIMTYAPAIAWKKSMETRSLLDAVLGSVTFSR